jgi:urease accessory protein
MRFVAVLAAVAFFPGIAFAHTGFHFESGFASGLAHPLLGIDHVLAMIGVGILAWQIGGRALWAMPAAFLAMMAAGGLAGFAAFDMPFVELGIALSIVAVGAAIAVRQTLPTALAACLVGFFAMFHGFAHGAEVPGDAGALGYMAGFLVASGALHVAGLGVGRFAARLRPTALRFGGAAIALAGLAFVAGI